MSSNHTANYNLSQWERTDKVLMDDFNADNAKIDAALGELSARVAGKAAQSALDTLSGRVARLGNCKIEFQTYTGTGTYGSGSPTVITFSGKPLLVMISNQFSALTLTAVQGDKTAVRRDITSGTSANVSWSGNSLSVSHNQYASGQMNELNHPYAVVAFIAADE